MESKRGFLYGYLVLSVVIGLLTIADAVLTLIGVRIALFVFIVAAALLGYFFFNMVAIAVFHHKGYERICFVLPIFFLVLYVVFAGSGLLLAALGTIEKFSFVLVLVSIAAGLFEIVFPFVVLKKLKVFEPKGGSSYKTKSWTPPKFW